MGSDTPPPGGLVSRPRSRREPTPLEQIPVWEGLVDDAAPISGDPPAGLDALLALWDEAKAES